MKTKIKKLNTKKCTPGFWCGRLPEIYGYGLIVFECTPDAAKKSLRKHFYIARKANNGFYTFPQAMENFGGTIVPISFGKLYDDNLYEM